MVGQRSCVRCFERYNPGVVVPSSSSPISTISGPIISAVGGVALTDSMQLSPVTKRRISAPGISSPSNGVGGAGAGAGSSSALPISISSPRPINNDTASHDQHGQKSGSPPLAVPTVAAHRSASFDSSGSRERSGSGSGAAAFGMGLLRGARDAISKQRDVLSKKLQRTSSDNNKDSASVSAGLSTGAGSGSVGGADGSEDSSSTPGSTQSWGRIENRMRGAISGVKSGLSGAISKLTFDGAMGGDAAAGHGMTMLLSRPATKPDNGIASLAEQELEHYCSGPRALAWTDFLSAKPEELSVLKGQSVALRKVVNLDWMVCTTVDGASGIVPQKYLTIIEPLPEQVMEGGVPMSERAPQPTLARADEGASAATAKGSAASAAAADLEGTGFDAPNEGTSALAGTRDAGVAGASADAGVGGSSEGAPAHALVHSVADEVEYFSSGPRATALSDFTPNMLMGLRLTKGQSVALRKDVNNDWVVATTTTGDSGLVPKAHLLFIEDLPQS